MAVREIIKEFTKANPNGKCHHCRCEYIEVRYTVVIDGGKTSTKCGSSWCSDCGEQQ